MAWRDWYPRPSSLNPNLNMTQSHQSTSCLTVAENSTLPKYSEMDIYVLEKLLGDGYIPRVSVNGQELCAKVADHVQSDSVQRELATLSTDKS